MSEKENPNGDLEEELEKAFKESEKRPSIFGIVSKEKEARDRKETRTKFRKKSAE